MTTTATDDAYPTGLVMAVAGELLTSMAIASGVDLADCLPGGSMREHDPADGMTDALEFWITSRTRGDLRVGVIPRSTLTELLDQRMRGRH